MKRRRGSIVVLALVVLGAVAAGAPSEPRTPAGTIVKRPGSAQSQPSNDLGRKPGKPAPGRGKASSTSGPRTRGLTPSQQVSVTVQVRPGPGTGPESSPDLSFRLGQSSPNPFHTTTSIVFVNPVRASGRLIVYDVQGKRVATLIDGMVDAGEYTIQWAGVGDDGKFIAPGVYVYRLTIGKHQSVRKLSFSR